MHAHAQFSSPRYHEKSFLIVIAYHFIEVTAWLILFQVLGCMGNGTEKAHI